MSKLLLILSLLSSPAMSQTKQSFYQFRMNLINGKSFDFADLKGKKVLLVNTATYCGNTPQYAELEKLYKEFGGEKFVILGFPANNFGAQEPGSNEEIATFCSKNFGVSFPMFEKISVKGEDCAALYQWLTKKDLNGVSDAEVSWNFQKFMIDEQGQWVGSVKASASPYSAEILGWLKKN